MEKWSETMPACYQPHSMELGQHFNIKWMSKIMDDPLQSTTYKVLRITNKSNMNNL